MRDLNTIELNAVSGGAMKPTTPTTLFGVKLSRKDQAALAAVIKLIRDRTGTKK